MLGMKLQKFKKNLISIIIIIIIIIIIKFPLGCLPAVSVAGGTGPRTPWSGTLHNKLHYFMEQH
jgi:hypothetical protein